MPAKKKTEPTPPLDDYQQWHAKLRAAQEALTAAENPNTFHHWLSPQQKYTVLDQIDSAMEELVYDMRNAPGLHVLPPLPDLTPMANLLLTELRGRLMRRMEMQFADKKMRHQLGEDR